MARRELNYNPSTKLLRDMTPDDLIVHMQEEQELSEQRQILEEMSPQLRERLEKIKELIETEVHSILLTRYALGEQFKAMFDDETNNGASVYGRHAIEHVCRLLGIEQSLARNCIRFVQIYCKEELETLASRTLPRGEHLSWSHIRCLMRVDDEKKRGELLEKTFADGLTCAELAYEIETSDDGDNEEENRGRPMKVPATFEALVKQQMQIVDQFERRNQKVWSHPKHSLVAKAAALPEEEITEQRLKEAEVLAHHLRGLVVEAQRAAERAESVVERFKLILIKKARIEEPKEEEDSDAAGKKKGKRKVAVAA